MQYSQCAPVVRFPQPLQTLLLPMQLACPLHWHTGQSVKCHRSEGQVEEGNDWVCNVGPETQFQQFHSIKSCFDVITTLKSYSNRRGVHKNMIWSFHISVTKHIETYEIGFLQSEKWEYLFSSISNDQQADASESRCQNVRKSKSWKNMGTILYLFKARVNFL